MLAELGIDGIQGGGMKELRRRWAEDRDGLDAVARRLSRGAKSKSAKPEVWQGKWTGHAFPAYRFLGASARRPADLEAAYSRLLPDKIDQTVPVWKSLDVLKKWAVAASLKKQPVVVTMLGDEKLLKMDDLVKSGFKAVKFRKYDYSNALVVSVVGFKTYNPQGRPRVNRGGEAPAASSPPGPDDGAGVGYEHHPRGGSRIVAIEVPDPSDQGAGNPAASSPPGSDERAAMSIEKFAVVVEPPGKTPELSGFSSGMDDSQSSTQIGALSTLVHVVEAPRGSTQALILGAIPAGEPPADLPPSKPPEPPRRKGIWPFTTLFGPRERADPPRPLPVPPAPPEEQEAPLSPRDPGGGIASPGGDAARAPTERVLPGPDTPRGQRNPRTTRRTVFTQHLTWHSREFYAAPTWWPPDRADIWDQIISSLPTQMGGNPDNVTLLTWVTRKCQQLGLRLRPDELTGLNRILREYRNAMARELLVDTRRDWVAISETQHLAQGHVGPKFGQGLRRLRQRISLYFWGGSLPKNSK